MNKTTFENLDVFYSNERNFYVARLGVDSRIKSLMKTFNKPAIYFAEAYLPAMYGYLNIFLQDQIKQGNPYSMPSKKLMMEYAKCLAMEIE